MKYIFLSVIFTYGTHSYKQPASTETVIQTVESKKSCDLLRDVSIPNPDKKTDNLSVKTTALPEYWVREHTVSCTPDQ